MKDKRVKWILVIVVSVVCIGVLYQTLSTSPYDHKAKIGTVDQKSQEEIKKIKEGREEGKRFVVMISPKIELKDGKSEGTFNIENAPDNNYIMEVGIYIKGEEKPIYQSQWIEVGKMIETDCLDTKLEKGEYLCEVIFTAIDEKTHEEVGTATYDTVIKIKG